MGLVAMNGQTAWMVIVAKLRDIFHGFNIKGKLFVAVFDGGPNLQTAKTALWRMHVGEGPSCVALRRNGMYFTICLAHLVINGACNCVVLLSKSTKFQIRESLTTCIEVCLTPSISMTWCV